MDLSVLTDNPGLKYERLQQKYVDLKKFMYVFIRLY